LNYLKEVALQDFSSDIAAGKDWLAANRDSTLAAAFSDALHQFVNTLRNSSGEPLHHQLTLLKRRPAPLSQFGDTIAATGLTQVLGDIASGTDAQAVELALESASQIPIGDDWRREIALPRLSSQNPVSIRAAAARVLAKSASDWPLDPLLNALSETVYSEKGISISTMAQALSELDSPRAIPNMIALIQAENTYETVYGIGYFGLYKMTGVTYDEKHDGAWWVQWWEKNKQRFPADVQAMEIPKFNPVKTASTGP
jgi:hypothetical protein